MDTSFSRLYEIAASAVRHNCIKTERGSYFRAGPNQFGSLWTRDFCFAVPGILSVGSSQLNLAVRDHLSRILNSLDPEIDVAPRMFDSIPSAIRVVAHTAGRKLPLQGFATNPREPMRPEHKGEHGTYSMDSNALVLIASAQYVQATGDTAWKEQFLPVFTRALHFYQRFRKNEIVYQAAYEDWQDSARREGATAYLNILYFYVISFAAKILGLSTEEVAATDLRRRLLEHFFHAESGLLRSIASRHEIGLDANLLAINYGFWQNADEERQRYMSLKAHPIWNAFAFPGCPTYPHYPSGDVSWTTKIVGLRHYHDDLLWTWLGGEAAKAAAKVEDGVEASRILKVLQDLAVRDGAILEVYSTGKETTGFETILYRSERPFTWGAGKILEALAAQR